VPLRILALGIIAGTRVFFRRHDFEVGFLMDIVTLESLRVVSPCLLLLAGPVAHGSPTVIFPCTLAVVTYQSVNGIVVPASGRLVEWLDGVDDLVVLDTTDAPLITTRAGVSGKPKFLLFATLV